jgi:hypothetical protein
MLSGVVAAAADTVTETNSFFLLVLFQRGCIHAVRMSVIDSTDATRSGTHIDDDLLLPLELSTLQVLSFSCMRYIASHAGGKPSGQLPPSYAAW